MTTDSSPEYNMFLGAHFQHRSVMAPDIRKRIIGDERYTHLQEVLLRTDQLIDQSNARIAAPAALLERMGRNGPELHAISRDLHRNLEEALKLLVDHRAMLTRELQYVERRRAS